MVLHCSLLIGYLPRLLVLTKLYTSLQLTSSPCYLAVKWVLTAVFHLILISIETWLQESQIQFMCCTYLVSMRLFCLVQSCCIRLTVETFAPIQCWPTAFVAQQHMTYIKFIKQLNLIILLWATMSHRPGQHRPIWSVDLRQFFASSVFDALSIRHGGKSHDRNCTKERSVKELLRLLTCLMRSSNGFSLIKWSSLDTIAPKTFFSLRSFKVDFDDSFLSFFTSASIGTKNRGNTLELKIQSHLPRLCVLIERNWSVIKHLKSLLYCCLNRARCW